MPPVQTAPAPEQAPQWFGSFWVLTQRSPQSVPDMPVQFAWQLPLEQYGAESEQVFPQAPQWFGSNCTLLHALDPPQWPVVHFEEPLQSVWSVGHLHVPLWQVAPESQAVPQAPQLLVSLVVSTQVSPQAVRPAQK